MNNYRLPFGVTPTNSTNQIDSCNGTAYALSARLPFWRSCAALVKPPFCDAIMNIFFLRAKPKMIGANAVAHITRMTYKHSARNFAIRKHVRKAVGRVAVFFKMKRPITTRQGSRSPQPTRIGFIHFRPESRFVLWGIMEKHHNLQLWCHAGGCLLHRAGFILPKLYHNCQFSAIGRGI